MFNILVFFSGFAYLTVRKESNLKILCIKYRKKYFIVRCGVRTHALFRVSELKSDALDRSANLTSAIKAEVFMKKNPAYTGSQVNHKKNPDAIVPPTSIVSRAI